jgi:hypothetical protein
MDPGPQGQSIKYPDPIWPLKKKKCCQIVTVTLDYNITIFKKVNFFLKFSCSFDTILRIWIFFTDPDQEGQLITDPPDPEHW